MIETVIKIPTKFVEDRIFGVKKNNENEKYWTQYLCTIAVSMTFFITGLQSGWCGPTLLKLSDENSSIPLTEAEQGWLAVSMLTGSIPGALCGSFLSDIIGRQKTLLLSTFPNMLAFVLVYFADNVFTLYISQSLSGFSMALSYIAVPIYISEISSPKIRGILGAIMGLLLGSGNVFEYITVPIMTMKTNAIVCFCITVASFISIFMVPETPYYYIMKDKIAESKQVLKFFRLKNDIDAEHKELETAWKETEDVKMIDILKSSTNRKCFMIVIGVFAAQEFNGMIPVIGYAPDIIERMHAPFSVHLLSVTLMVIFTITTVSSTFFVDSWGRKPLLAIATFGCVIPYTLVGTYFYLQQLDVRDIHEYSLVPVVSLISAGVCYGGAMNTLPFIYASELFPTNYRATAGSVGALFSSFMEITGTKGFQVIRDSVGIYWCFWFFAGFNVISGLMGLLFIPETKGKSLEQIQNELKKK